MIECQGSDFDALVEKMVFGDGGEAKMYAADITACKLVWEKMISDGWTLRVRSDKEKYSVVFSKGDTQNGAWGLTLEGAICFAAVLAKREEEGLLL